jgi:cytochrome c oxidase subunit 2
MITKVKVISAEDFRKWYQEDMSGITGKDEKEGSELLRKKGCLACHSIDGSKKIGPTFKGLFGSSVTIVAAGKDQEITVDEAYLRRAVMEPQADIVKGFPPVMPPQKDSLTAAELEEIIEYIKELK